MELVSKKEKISYLCTDFTIGRACAFNIIGNNVLRISLNKYEFSNTKLRKETNSEDQEIHHSSYHVGIVHAHLSADSFCQHAGEERLVVL